MIMKRGLELMGMRNGLESHGIFGNCTIIYLMNQMNCRNIILIKCPSEFFLYPFCDNYCDQYSIPEVSYNNEALVWCGKYI